MTNATQHYINDEHQVIFEQTKDIPGWQVPGDSEKLYELAYTSGDVILEIGVYSGRSAVVELKGGLANPERTTKPQFYGIDLDPAAIWRSYKILNSMGLSESALLYYGDLQRFTIEFQIRPTMVFLDGDHRYEGVKRDLTTLARVLAPNTPVFCHDYANLENDSGEMGVRKAVTEFVDEGWATFEGVFGCSCLLKTTNQVGGGHHVNLSPLEFATRKATLLESYAIGLNEYLAGVLQENQGVSQWEQKYSELETQTSKVVEENQVLKQELRSFLVSSNELESEIAAMKTSKFWQIRTKWFGLKRTLGLPT